MAICMIIDSETGGLEAGAPVLSLAWQVFDGTTGKVGKVGAYYFDDGIERADKRALDINGLHPDELRRRIDVQGSRTTLAAAIGQMMQDAELAGVTRIMAYNLGYDVKMIMGVLHGEDACKLSYWLDSHELVCVMHAWQDVKRTDRWVTLSRAYKEATGMDAVRAHDALIDCSMTRRVWMHLEEC